ncbi:uncharacterized protein P174DRAFT_497465 [Aspergillus novofumigatus IBT 16806]|uniref:Integral membrane protein n=1 Tax=Aspergillus novofumigatus (strain IBT 16806) TaxID=1392255 RepID=A0A2I1BYM5_ASPN1|nr:uncharacterized protein P174DRAFT_497465 [Aspergillus novofumigatus IBT 16806]PKX90479.1 integral membrane protein [Aspergillus novofumigatus IBT 16806]
MDGFGDANAPPNYQAVKPIADFFVVLMGAGWAINYFAMVHKSFQDQSYAMAIMPLCCNMAWEVVYGLIYPSPNPLEMGLFLIAVAIDFAVIYAAIRFSPNEWTHAPLVRDNLPWIFLFGIVGFITGHLALAAEVGPALAYTYGAALCQLLLSLGAICQLLCRCSTRGASFTLWLSRFLGTVSATIFIVLRWWYWPESFDWLNSPLLLWSFGAWLLLDPLYIVCYWHVKQYEQRLGAKYLEKGK